MNLGALGHSLESLGHSPCDTQVFLMNVREISVPPRATRRHFCLPCPLWSPPYGFVWLTQGLLLDGVETTCATGLF